MEMGKMENQDDLFFLALFWNTRDTKTENCLEEWKR